MLKISKTFRILDIYTDLLNGKTFTAKERAVMYDKSERSIARDVRDLKTFVSDKAVKEGLPYELYFDKKNDSYKLANINVSKLSNDEILAVSKIVLASRAFSEETMHSIINKLVESCSTNENIKFVKTMISNELYHYVEPAHKQEFLENMWILAEAIKNTNYIEIEYFRMQDKNVVNRKLRPLAIMFSEYYFYLIAHISSDDVDIDDMKPIIYRVDRIKSINVLESRFNIPYKDRFEEGVFRKRIQFMQGGELEEIKFVYKGESIEAIIDRLPDAKITNKGNGEYEVEALVYGRGFEMWIRAQGDRIEIL